MIMVIKFEGYNYSNILEYLGHHFKAIYIKPCMFSSQIKIGNIMKLACLKFQDRNFYGYVSLVVVYR